MNLFPDLNRILPPKFSWNSYRKLIYILLWIFYEEGVTTSVLSLRLIYNVGTDGKTGDGLKDEGRRDQKSQGRVRKTNLTERRMGGWSWTKSKLRNYFGRNLVYRLYIKGPIRSNVVEQTKERTGKSVLYEYKSNEQLLNRDGKLTVEELMTLV